MAAALKIKTLYDTFTSTTINFDLAGHNYDCDTGKYKDLTPNDILKKGWSLIGPPVLDPYDSLWTWWFSKSSDKISTIIYPTFLSDKP